MKNADTVGMAYRESLKLLTSPMTLKRQRFLMQFIQFLTLFVESLHWLKSWAITKFFCDGWTKDTLRTLLYKNQRAVPKRSHYNQQ